MFRFKWISAILVLILLFALAACGAKDAPPVDAGSAAGDAAAPPASLAPAAAEGQSEPEAPEAQEGQAAPGAGAGAAGADLVIPIGGISETATFYPVAVDDVVLEVLAVTAPDGTIRTAFNTCQVCFDSGRGYYKQDGNVLVCQNCGNRFKMDQVEVASGGCNPVPIFDEYKTVDDENITIPFDFLKEAKAIFGNWKSDY
ncbi:MAG: DUF2318 domain-containing protein [Clostridiales Family XIII bacterium]|nr:DUF2318 domain-containing protein [Clostridiales Family XIII bacterium]